MLSFTSSEEKQNQCFHLLGTVKPNNHTGLISNNVSLISANHSLLSDCGNDVCSFYSGPSDSTILSFGEQAESCGSIGYSSGSVESCGSIAYSSGGSTESCGSIASSSSGGFSGGGCSYSC